MRKIHLLSAVFVFLATLAFGQFSEGIATADELYEDDQLQASVSELEAALSDAGSGAERAEVYWRLSRATLGLGEDLEDAGADTDRILETYTEGEEYGRSAIEADPSNHLGYYWTSANIGKWGQTRGILNSLIKAGPMRDLLAEAIERDPEHADSYYVLGQLYAQVPGLMSFGNDNYAVSLGRKSVDLKQEQSRQDPEEEFNEDFRIQLASHLIERDWNARKRRREQSGKAEQYRNTSNLLEKNFHYEGVVDIPDMSDVDEAEELLRTAISELESRDELGDGERRNLEDARELLSQL